MFEIMFEFSNIVFKVLKTNIENVKRKTKSETIISHEFC